MALTTLTKIGKGITSLFKAKGATHARGLEDRFSDIINVKDFGAIGDGVADDTTAIQAAIDTIDFSAQLSWTSPVSAYVDKVSRLNQIFFPEGQYLVSSTLKIRGACYLKGASPHTLIFTNSNISKIISFRSNDSDQPEWITGGLISDLRVLGNGDLTQTGMIGIESVRQHQWVFDRVTVAGCRVGLSLQGSYGGSVVNSVLCNNRDALHCDKFTVTNPSYVVDSNAITMQGCTVINNTYGIRISSGELSINGGYIQVNNFGAVFIDADRAYYLRFHGVYFEANGSTSQYAIRGIQGGKLSNLYIEACHIYPTFDFVDSSVIESVTIINNKIWKTNPLNTILKIDGITTRVRYRNNTIDPDQGFQLGRYPIDNRKSFDVFSEPLLLSDLSRPTYMDKAFGGGYGEIIWDIDHNYPLTLIRPIKIFGGTVSSQSTPITISSDGVELHGVNLNSTGASSAIVIGGFKDVKIIDCGLNMSGGIHGCVINHGATNIKVDGLKVTGSFSGKSVYTSSSWSKYENIEGSGIQFDVSSNDNRYFNVGTVSNSVSSNKEI